MSLPQFTNILMAKPRQLFLIDALGALLSAFLLGVVLVTFEPIFGMPVDVLYCLALVAVVFAVFSFFYYLWNPKNWPSFLKIIAISNVIYCAVTMGLVIYLYAQLTALGVLYFILEVLVILSLVRVEWKVADAAEA